MPWEETGGQAKRLREWMSWRTGSTFPAYGRPRFPSSGDDIALLPAMGPLGIIKKACVERAGRDLESVP